MKEPSQPWHVVRGVENIPGGSGPDYALIYLRDGRVLMVGDEGVNVFDSFNAFTTTGNPVAGLLFPDVCASAALREPALTIPADGAASEPTDQQTSDAPGGPVPAGWSVNSADLDAADRAGFPPRGR